MASGYQIILGSIVLCICAVWHIFALIELIALLREREEGVIRTRFSDFRLTASVVLAILFAHTVQIYFWAGIYWLSQALPDFSQSIYFSLVTYTTLGYGDVVLGEGFRIFAAMESITGVLMFGITTAFLVGFFTELAKPKS